MTLSEYTAPECQFRDCDAEAELSREYPTHGGVQVCETCASLWGGDGE